MFNIGRTENQDLILPGEREVLVSLLHLLNGVYGQELWNKTAMVFVKDSKSTGTLVGFKIWVASGGLCFCILQFILNT